MEVRNTHKTVEATVLETDMINALPISPRANIPEYTDKLKPDGNR